MKIQIASPFLTLFLLGSCAVSGFGAGASERPLADVLPLDRTAYFVGETVPLALTGAGVLKLEAVSTDGRTLLYTEAVRSTRVVVGEGVR